MASLLISHTLIIGILAVRSFAIPAPLPLEAATLSRRVNSLSCWDNVSNGQVFQAANSQWDIQCGKDYAGGDMGMSWVDSFESCIADCDTTIGCVDVSFVWPNACYKKNVLGAVVDNQAVWTASKRSDRSAVPTTSLTCDDGVSDGAIYTSAHGTFVVHCGVDYAGGDMGSSSVVSFEACIEDCASTSGCVDVSFVWPNACYKKNVIGASGTNSAVWTAKKQSATDTTVPTTSLSCADGADDGTSYTSSQGTFLIECGVDYAGGDMGSSSVISFEACIEDCATTAGCVDVSYVNGACYKKSSLNAAVSVSHVWSAKLVPSETDDDATSTTSTVTATATAVPITCPGSDGTTVGLESGGTYQVLCGIDYAGGDFLEVDVASFELCLEACDNNLECVGLSYVAPSCYLKSELLTAADVSYVWGAIVTKSAADAFTFPTYTDTELAPGERESMMAEPMTLESPPLATLGPVAPPGINMGGLKVLTPDPQTQLWYNGDDDSMEDEDSGAVTVRLTIDYLYPSIVLEHSIYITSVTCSGGVLTGSFSENTPFLHAAEEWPSQAPLLLITSEESCGDNGAQNTFWLASSVSFDTATMSFSAPGEPKDLGNIYTNMDIDFGNIEYSNDTENSTVAYDGAAACGSPASLFIDDLPAVDCGAEFDQTLDAAIGFIAATGGDEQQVLAAIGIDISDNTDSELRRRGFFSWVAKAVKVVAKVIVQAAVAVVQQAVAVVVQVVQKAVEVVKTVVETVVAVTIAVATQVAKLVVFIATGNYSNSLTLPVNLGPPTSVQEESPWGSDGFKFYTYTPEEGGEKWEASAAALDRIQGELIGEADPEPGIELWCVDCGVRGKVVATGSISATPLSGLKSGSIGIHGNMYAGVFLGVNAFTQWEKTIRKDLFVKGLPGWSIPGIVELGPRLILAAQASISVEAEGQIITGASLNWPAFEATLDFVDRSHSTSSGWTPELTKKFQAHGEVTATAALGLPVIVSFGINLLNGQWEKSINLTDIPAITAEASFEISLGTEENQVGSDDCYGVDWDISLTNEVRLDVSDGPGFTLKQWASPALASGCIGYDRTGDDDDDDSGDDDGGSTTLPPVEDLSTKCPAADGQTYTDSSLNTYTVKCNYDSPGYDFVGSSVQSNFDECMNLCGTITGCVGVTWVPADSLCWPKSSMPAGSMFADSRNGYAVWTATMNSPFTILSMYYADRDIAWGVSQYVITGNRLMIDTNNLWTWAGDPWSGNRKSIVLLYMYGAETRIYVSADYSGVQYIVPGPASSSPNNQVVPSIGQQWGVQNLQLIAVTYSLRNIDSLSVWQNIYYNMRVSGQWQFTNTNFGVDPWNGIVKTGVIFYKDNWTGSFYAMAVRENVYGRFATVHYGRKARRNEIDAPYSMANATVNGSANSTMATPAPVTTPSRVLLDTVETPFAQLTVTNGTANARTNATTTEFPQLVMSNTTTNATNETGTGLTLLRVVDTTDTLSLNPGINGNLFMSILSDTTTDLSNLTTASLAGDAESKTVVGDSNSRLLHYYPDVMARTGASRIRLADWDKLPHGAKAIALTPIEAGGVSMLVAIDTDGSYFWPFFCGIKGQLNKVFLVRDHEAGADILQAENLKFTLTGGDAYSCSPLALKAYIS